MLNNMEFFSAQKKYIQLMSMKMALGVQDNEEISTLELLERSKEHNKEEIFLLEYIIKKMKDIPQIISVQFDNLINLCSCLDFKDKYCETELLFQNEPIFKLFYDEIYEELEFDIEQNKHFFNSIIYEIVYNENDINSIFSIRNPIMNLYLLQKWLKTNYQNLSCSILPYEQLIIQFILKGYTNNEIYNSLAVFHYSQKAADIAINSTIPSKFGVSSIVQALALYLYSI